MDQFYTDIEAKYNDGINWKLHYVSAREMYNIIKAAEAGMTGDPGNYRDFIIKPYANMKILSKNRYNLIYYSPTMVLLRMLGTVSLLDFSLKDFDLCANIEESSDPNIGWFISDASLTKGALFDELRFKDSTPSPFYRITSQLSENSSDLNNDQIVNFFDYVFLCKYWLDISCDSGNNWCEGADICRNNTVDERDLLVLTAHWLESMLP
jgi:hypothetical protein